MKRSNIQNLITKLYEERTGESVPEKVLDQMKEMEEVRQKQIREAEEAVAAEASSKASAAGTAPAADNQPEGATEGIQDNRVTDSQGQEADPQGQQAAEGQQTTSS